MTVTRPEATLDIECFHNWFLVGITDSAAGVEWDYQMTTGGQLDIASITALLQHYTIVTFNGNNYDVPMLMLALQGADCAMLKAANDDIICNGLKSWAFYKKYSCYPPDWFDHIDVSEPTPGVRVSLKQYACRMHSELVQDTPVDFNLPLPLHHAVEEILYCRNDRKVTAEIRELIDERIKVRIRMSERYGVDLRSKSDAQMAEAMVKAEWSRLMRSSAEKWSQYTSDMIQAWGIKPDPRQDNTGDYPHLAVPNYDVDYRGNPRPIIPHYPHGTTFKAKLPHYIEFVTPQMQQFLTTVRNCEFFISNKDEAELMGIGGENIRTGVLIPDELKGRDIKIGNSTYRVGIGGLHSQESSVTHRSVQGVQTLRTADVASYYPSMILNAGMNPPQLGPLFLSIYRSIYDDRIAGKLRMKEIKGKPGHEAELEDLLLLDGGKKVSLNGTFGKLFSRFSIFYAPEFGIAVTIGGQLSLLMLIERLELAGIQVVSANTDGVEMLIPAGREWVAEQIMDWWQGLTSLTLETKDYRSLHSRDVNNYISVQNDGSVKRKGAYGESGLLNNKHPDCDICADAVVAYLTAGTPIMSTVMACRDIRKFIRVRGAKGGAVWFQPDNPDHAIIEGALLGGEYMGRAVRWYYARGSKDYIIDAKSLNKVAGSDGAHPIPRLPATMPDDVNYEWYVRRAEEMLRELGS